MIADYKTLIPYVKRYILRYVAGLLCLLLIIGGQLIVPQFIRLAIDALSQQQRIIGIVIGLMAQMLGVTLVIVLARFGWRHFLAVTARKVETELRDDVYRKLVNLSHDFYQTITTGEVIARLTNDLRAIRMACGFAIVSIVDGLVMSFAIIIFLISRYPRLALIILIPLPCVSVIVFLSSKVITKRFTKIQEGYADITEEVRLTLNGIRTIKQYGKEDYFLERFHKKADTYRQRNLSYARIWSFVYPFILFFAGLSNVLLIFFGAQQVVDQQITLGDLVSIFTYLEILIWPMIGAGFTITLFAQGAASLKRINFILNAKQLIRSPKNAKRTVGGHAITVQNLTYTYPESRNAALDNITLTINAGAHVGIIGRIASGKSTFAQLLSRLLDPPPRTIFLDGVDIRTYDLDLLRKTICLVNQVPYLFSESIKNNINFTVDEARQNDAALAHILKTTAIDAESVEFPQGISTHIGEQGIMISGGQKQRIAIARALMSNPPIIIFDDTVSALDSETENIVLNNIYASRTGKSSIIISNRVQSLARCSYVYVLDYGKIVQEGAPQALKKERGLYQDLWRLQSPTER